MYGPFQFHEFNQLFICTHNETLFVTARCASLIQIVAHWKPGFAEIGYGEPNAVSNATGYATHRSRSHDAARV